MISERQRRKLKWSKKKLMTRGGRGKYLIDQKELKRLAQIFVGIKKIGQSKDILQDLLTEREQADIIRRVHIAELLRNGLKYREIKFITGSSETTVAHVQEILKKGGRGLNEALDKIRSRA